MRIIFLALILAIGSVAILAKAVDDKIKYEEHAQEAEDAAPLEDAGNLVKRHCTNRWPTYV